MTAERRSTAAARFSMLMPLERRTRPASTEVRRSSQSLTGRWVRFSSAAANSRTHTDCRPSVPRILMGLPSRIMPTSRWRMSCSSRSRSVRMRVRTRLGRPCAVMPKGSLMASPMRRLPRSRARIRVKAGVKQFHYRLVRATVETKVVYRAVAVVTQPSSSTTSVVREARHIALPILALGVVIAILYLGRLFFITSLIALTIAFILEPFVALLMRIRFPRSLASFVVCSFALALLYVIGMGAYSQLSGLYDELPKYGQSIGDLVDGIQQKINAMEDQTYKVLVPARQRQEEERRKQQEQALAAARKGKKGAAPANASSRRDNFCWIRKASCARRLKKCAGRLPRRNPKWQAEIPRTKPLPQCRPRLNRKRPFTFARCRNTFRSFMITRGIVRYAAWRSCRSHRRR